jgi:small-conductance mechanosensitive channel
VSGEVVNHSRPTTNLRIRIVVGVAYGSDTDRVKRVLLDVAKNEAAVMANPPPEVRLEDFGESRSRARSAAKESRSPFRNAIFG